MSPKPKGSAQLVANSVESILVGPVHPYHPFLWKETRRGCGTTSVRTPLKMTFGGTFAPSAATARTTVKLRFSAPQDFTGTVRLPLNSSVRFDGSSKRMGVSSML